MYFLSFQAGILLLLSILGLLSDAAPTNFTSPRAMEIWGNATFMNLAYWEPTGAISAAVSNECWSSVEMLEPWNEWGMKRSRLMFKTDQIGMTDEDYKHAKYLWDRNDRDMPGQRCASRCKSCLTVNVQVYYHKELNSWVIDSSEVEYSVGTTMAWMALRRFAWRWERFTGCELNSRSTETYYPPADWVDNPVFGCWEPGWSSIEGCTNQCYNGHYQNQNRIKKHKKLEEMRKKEKEDKERMKQELKKEKEQLKAEGLDGLLDADMWKEKDPSQ